MIRIALTAAALATAALVPAAPARVEVAPVVQVHDHSAHVHVHEEPPPVVEPEVAPAPVRPSTVRPLAEPGAMFRTVESAMRYLASAYNRHDLVSLKHVTTPDARTELENMRAVATDLRLEKCEWSAGYYSCTFSHAYPKAKKGGAGKAWVMVAPARKPGWYMTVLEGCG